MFYCPVELFRHLRQLGHVLTVLGSKGTGAAGLSVHYNNNSKMDDNESSEWVYDRNHPKNKKNY